MWEPTSCCCFSRRTGSLILGTMLLVFASIKLLGFLLSVISSDTDQIIEEVCAEEKDLENCNEIVKKAVIGTYVTFFIVNTVQVVFCSMLIYGILNKKTCMQVPFMIMYLIYIIMAMLLVLIVMGLLAFNRIWLGMFVFILIGGLYIFLETYFLLVIRANYLEIRRGKAQARMRWEEESKEAPIPYSALYPIQNTAVTYNVLEKPNQC